jgi:phosphoribosylformylglycinamidine cyclo-ligase
MITPRPGSHRDKTSKWSSRRRDLATPQGSNIVSAFLLCAIIAIVFDVVGRRVFGLPKSVLYPTIVIVNVAILVVAAFRISTINKQAEAARREIYQQKFGGDMEAIRTWSERRSAGSAGEQKRSLTYEDSGVSIDTMHAALDDVGELIKSTYRSEVIGELGQFGGLFALDKSKYDDPVLVSSTDSVGTKLKVAFMTGRHNTVGADLVAHCGNDIVVMGAEPLFFLDYLGISKLDGQVMVQLVEGLAAGCKEVGCALIGGETAELPTFYQSGEYDLVGCIVGVVDRQKIIAGDRITPGDRVIGLASVGLHTNGYSLARKIMFEVCGYGSGDFVQELGTTVADELLKPHRSYVKPVLELVRRFNTDRFVIKGLAHITGGGLLDNVPRILPEDCSAVIEKGAWEIPAVFSFLQEKGNVAEDEMYRTFNMGVGMVAVVPADSVFRVTKVLEASGETVYTIGKVVKGSKKVSLV